MLAPQPTTVLTRNWKLLNKLLIAVLLAGTGWLTQLYLRPPAHAQVNAPIIYGYYDPYTGDWYQVYYNPDGSVQIEGGNVVTSNQFTQTTSIQGTTTGRDRFGNYWINDENTGYTVLSNGIVCTGKGIARFCNVPTTVRKYPVPPYPIYGVPIRLW